MFKKVRVFSLNLLCLWLWSLAILTATSFADIPIAKPGCPTKCGNVTIYYPFGIGLDGSCSLSEFHNINCNFSYDPPTPFLNSGNLELLDISIIGQMQIRSIVATAEYRRSELIPGSLTHSWTRIRNSSAVFSNTKNKFTLIGCDDYGQIYGSLGRSFRTGCDAGCFIPSDPINGSCSGIGCCQTSIPKGLRSFDIYVKSYSNHTLVNYFNPFSFAFLGEEDKFIFNVADLNDTNFAKRINENVPIVLDWFVGVNQTCAQAKKDISTYACQSNTNCTDFDGVLGYRCSCLPGYEGNPYLSPGCTEIVVSGIFAPKFELFLETWNQSSRNSTDRFLP